MRRPRCQDCDARATRGYFDGRDGSGECVAYVCELDGAKRDRERDEFYDELDARTKAEADKKAGDT